MKGSCLCGGVTFEAVGEPAWVAHCHCRSCQKATGAAFATYAGFKSDRVELAGPFQVVSSSEGAWRSFCRECGSPVFFKGDRWPDEIHLFASLFDDPHALAPASHVHTSTKLSWIHLDDGLSSFAGFSEEDG